MDWWKRLWTWLTVWALMTLKEAWAACTMAQFPCRSQQCIGLDQYCDGVKHCADGSDEPAGCSRKFYTFLKFNSTLIIEFSFIFNKV